MVQNEGASTCRLCFDRSHYQNCDSDELVSLNIPTDEHYDRRFTNKQFVCDGVIDSQASCVINHLWPVAINDVGVNTKETKMKLKYQQ